MKEHHVSIWFLIGLLLTILGLLITGAGIYGYFVPPAADHQTVLGYLYPAIWWGAIMFLTGLFYAVKFRPRKTAS